MKNATLRRGVMLTLFGTALAATTPAAAQSVQLRHSHPRPIAIVPARVAARAATAQDRPLESLTQYWVNGAYADSSRIRYTQYDANGNNTERFIDNNRPGTWQVQQQRLFIYNAQNQEIRDTVIAASGRRVLSNAWSYTATGKIDTKVQSLHLAQWTEFFRDSYTYDGNDKPEQLLWEDKIGSAWVPSARFLYTTDAQGRIVTDEYQYTDIGGTAFFNSDKTALTYVGTTDSLSTATTRAWSVLNQAYDSLTIRSVNRFATTGLLDSVYVYTYDHGALAWVLNNVTAYAYDARQNRTAELLTLGATVAGQAPYRRRRFTYTSVSGLAGDNSPTSTPLLVSPNPAASETTVRFTLPAATPVATVELLDVLGRRAVAPVRVPSPAAGVHSATLDLRGVSAGLYVARLTAGTRVQQVKVVVE